MVEPERTHYEVLGVADTATTTEIVAAIRRLQLQHHPDRGGDARVFAAIGEAKAVLTDPGRRRNYDQQLQVRRAGRARQGNASHPVAIFLAALELLAEQPTSPTCRNCGRRITARFCAYCWAVNP